MSADWINEECLWGEETYRCSRCGAALSEPTAHCPHCGSEMKEIRPAPPITDGGSIPCISF